jgi:hypothetical protein
VDVSRLSKHFQTIAAKAGRDAMLIFLKDPDNEVWFNAQAADCANKWHSMLALGLGVQIKMYQKRPTREFIKEFVSYMVREHFIAWEPPAEKIATA